MATSESKDSFAYDNKYSDDLYYTTAVTALILSGYHRDQVMGAVRLFVSKHGRIDFNAEDLLLQLQQPNAELNQKKFSENHSENKANLDIDELTRSLRSIEFDGQKTSPTKSETELLLDENRNLEELKVCKICLNNKVNVVFLPCGHICSCSQCSSSLRKCAICREFIKSTVRVNVM